MLDILKIIYQFEHHAATTLEISMVRDKLGYLGEKSYNSLIVQNGKRVKEYLKKEPIYSRESGEELFWGIFFDGEELDGKTIVNSEVKVGKSADSGGWSLSRVDLNDFLPIDDYEGTYPITVDGIEAEGKFNINARLFYKSDELKNHLEQLAETDPNQKVPIEIEFHDVNRKGFQFTLKKELIKAIETLYDDLEVKYPHNFKLLEQIDLNDYDSLENYFNEDLSEDDLKQKYGSFYDYLIDNGYTFDKETIENFLLSLKIKPFVILTGNSGTGKTKLSQLFSQYLSGTSSNENSTKDLEINANSDYIPAKIKVSTILKNNEAAIKNEFLTDYIPINDYLGRFDGFLDDVPCKFGLNIVSYIRFKKSFINNYIKPNYSSEDIIDIKIRKSDIVDFLPKPDFKGFTEFKFNIGSFPKFRITHLYKEDHINFFNLDDKLRGCEVVIDGESSVGKFYIFDSIVCLKSDEVDSYLEKLSQKTNETSFTIKLNLDSFERCIDSNDNEDFEDLDMGVDSLETEENYKIIPVGANWTENRNIVGYYNVITNKYESTPAYDLIKQSQGSNEPHFLILDEMNLSHVERYFADFLSAIESGEDIPLYGTEPLEIPSNLFIIGTVNVDETTYMFSPKVLDRANVLEFETPSARDYILGRINNEAPDGDLSYLEDPMAGSEVRDYDINDLRAAFEGVISDGKDFWEVLSLEIDSFQTILKGSGFEFGFRVINEIIRFMLVAWRYEGSPEEWDGWERYFDAQIKQKILPKLHGSEKIIGETLNKLYKECLDTVIDDKAMKKYPESSDKLEEMIDVLRKQRYVSFIN